MKLNKIGEYLKDQGVDDAELIEKEINLLKRKIILAKEEIDILKIELTNQQYEIEDLEDTINYDNKLLNDKIEKFEKLDISIQTLYDEQKFALLKIAFNKYELNELKDLLKLEWIETV